MIKSTVLMLSFVVYTFFGSAIEYGANPVFDHKVVRADMTHLEPLLQLIAGIPSNSDDRKKIVIFPEIVRKSIFQKAIKEGKLFVAVKNDELGKVLGYKKLFRVPEDELIDLLFDEIRCLGQARRMIDSYLIEMTNGLVTKQFSQVSVFSDDFFYRYPVFYTGVDYVDPEFRARGICSQLYQSGLETVFSTYKELLKDYILVVYGLVQSNDYQPDGSGKSRTASIAKEFYNALLKYRLIAQIYLIRYRSSMPCFDEQGVIRENNGEPGYGNCLIFKLGDQVKGNL